MRRLSGLKRHGVLAVSGSNRLKELEQMPESGRSCQESSRRLSARLFLPLNSGPERVGLGVEPGLLSIFRSLETYRGTDLDHDPEQNQEPSRPSLWYGDIFTELSLWDQNKSKHSQPRLSTLLLCALCQLIKRSCEQENQVAPKP